VNVEKHNETEFLVMLRSRLPAAYEKLYDMYSGSLNRVIYSIVGDEETSKDILQDTFIKIWENIRLYDDKKGRLFTWMLNIARNNAIDHLRSSGARLRKNQIPTDSLKTHVQEKVGGSSTMNVDTIGVREMLGVLSPEQRTVIEKAYFEGLTREIISEELGIPVGTVKTQLRTALIRLRQFTKENASRH